MAEIINMPKLGFDMAEGTLVRWVKNVGETINKGEVLAEIETDKATVEVESSFSGVVLQQLVDAGTSVPVNTPIAVVGVEGEQLPVASDQLPVASNQSSADTTTAQPDNRTTAQPDNRSTVQPDNRPTVQPNNRPTESASALTKASPLAKKVARERGVDLGSVVGTGPGGRIVRRDIEAILKGSQLPVASSQPETLPTANLQPTTLADESIPTTKLRQAIGRRLVESKTTIPHFYVTHEYKMDALMDMRKQVNAVLPDGEKLSVNDFVLKGVALALRQFPNLNAMLKGAEVIQFGQVNVGVAVTVPGGLMTVVVKDTDRKTLRQISGEVKAMAARARSGKVKPEDVDGSTFSTSNLGMYDVEDFIAIINPPEAAILAIGSAREVPVVSGGQIVPGWRMKATISVDHRISDGAEAAQFLQALAGFLENPVRLLV
ncbi:MAG: hypothetical protein CO094_06795 [Anaerolineae bacterium CG_4_9_14_3_um_filter_57_17]|nr:2-oxo acid dehydrogenase subunit E2 [bacterium]NCT21753.1 2-oxo acid dehydrogenase subunit E2 [bacterium]OIO86418.1 MAG: hypothetical protein AUK01_03240 [Anaerolineae bacterium CG2_30_57_67]PJB66571.1 MAG: hypothetical protein CO094_06795 [Anaerolineae bacterium CG_4_9_14_3_um_filter_57_17]